MFWDKWIPHKYWVKSEVFVVEACYGEEGPVYYYTHLKNKNNKLVLAASGILKDLELPVAIQKNKIPLVLVLNGKGVVVKKLGFNEENPESFEDLLRDNLPAINAEEFYIQLYRQENGTGFISFCRRDILNVLLDQVAKRKYDLAKIFIGAPAVIGLKPLWSKFSAVRLSVQRVELTNSYIDVINSVTATEGEILQLEDLTFSSEHTLGLAGGLAYLTQRSIAENNNPTLETLFAKHQEKNKFKFLILILVGVTFILAVTNVFFYSSYFDKNNKLETELSVYQGKYDQINQLLSDYQRNKDLIEDAGVLGKNRLSEYADRIGKTLPDEVVLSELYFNPKLQKEDTEDSLVTFQNKQLVLKGNCEKSFIVNEWLSVLKMQKFIKEVNLEKFVYNNNGVAPNFEIKVITE